MKSAIETAEILNKAKSENRRIIAIGTTTTRCLETSISKNGKFIAERSAADLTITPGYKFKAISGLLTNFHLPKSSLLVLVSTFAGHEFIMNAYKYAVASELSLLQLRRLYADNLGLWFLVLVFGFIFST